MALVLRNTGPKSNSRPCTGFGSTGGNKRQAKSMTIGPMAVTKNALRQPKLSATSCETRKEMPTPNEKLDVYSVIARDESPGAKRSVSAFRPGMYAPAKPMPAIAWQSAPDHRPVPNMPNSNAPTPPTPEPP